MSPESELDPETRALLSLQLVPGLGPRLTRALLDRFGSATAVLEATAAELAEIPHLRSDVAHLIVRALQQPEVEREWSLVQQHRTRLIPSSSPEFPAPLTTIYDPPSLLYAQGAWIPEDANAVAIIGSRHCTAYGRRVAERLADGLARAGFTIISGLARGIDGIAHEAALNAGGRSIAVLAGGLSRIYPPEHAELAERLARQGAVLSETPMAAQPLPQMFPQRNRLISGLSLGVVIVEAAEKSGALLTAAHAAEQGREVFAVPGPIDSPTSGGTLKLIKDGATLVRGVQDILDVLRTTPAPARETSTGTTPAPTAAVRNVPVTPEQQRLLDAFADPVMHGDDLVTRSGMPVTEVSTALVLLEMQGLLRRLPGNRYERR